MVFPILLSLPPACLSYGQALFRQPEYRQVFEICDRRDVDRLLSLLGGSDALDERILFALANVQTDRALPAIFAALEHPVVSVRAAAAFALGQTCRLGCGRQESERKALHALVRETEPSVRISLLEALGEFGGKESFEGVMRFEPRLATEAAAQACSLARFAARGLRSRESAERLSTLHRAFQTECSVRRNVLYGLYRTSDSALLAPHEGLVAEALTDPDPQVRMFAAAAAGRIRVPTLMEPLMGLLIDTVIGVRVNAVRALVLFSADPPTTRKIAHAIRLLMVSPDYQTVKAALQAVGSLHPEQRTVLSLKKFIDTCTQHDLYGDAIKALASAYPDFAADAIAHWRTADTPPPAVIEAVGIIARRRGRTDASSIRWVDRYLESSDPYLAATAASSWFSFWREHRLHGMRSQDDSTADTYFEARALAALRIQSTEHHNAAAVQTIVEGLSDSLFRSPSHAGIFAESLAAFSPREDMETVIMLMNAIGRTRNAEAARKLLEFLDDETAPIRTAAMAALQTCGIETPSRSSPSQPRIDWTPLLRLRGFSLLDIETERGRIRILLHPDDAPLTVLGILHLVLDGFYDSLTFHRVVPNFVVQGGDPRGDGTGGSPHSLRTEFSRRKFERGAVGMASSGKDTESSQFFIMHSAAPHLDGRYTLFGTVVEGMGVVDKLRIGDRILTVRVEDVSADLYPQFRECP
ncbi:MAG: peptidylprolyl isomerase [Bacteroidota bacterium]|nr:peptidylprolyl isomerase [Bacteroidota bacterium]